MKISQLKKIHKILMLAVGILIIWGAWSLWQEDPPHFFPLDDSKGIYTITKKCPSGQGTSEAAVEGDTAYCVEYKGDHVFDGLGKSAFFRITVGESEVDLAPFEGKRVMNIKGNYTTSAKQCIVDTCTNINGPFVVLDIDSLERVRE